LDLSGMIGTGCRISPIGIDFLIRNLRRTSGPLGARDCAARRFGGCQRQGGSGVFVAASSHCFGDLPFAEAVPQLVDLEYDKIDLWLDETSPHLKPSELAAHPDRFLAQYRELSRMTAVAIHLQHDPGTAVFDAICRLGKHMRITQITLPS